MNLLLAFLVFLPFLGGLCMPLWSGRTSKKQTGILSFQYAADLFVIGEFLLVLVLFLQYGSQNGEETVLNCFIPEICGFGLHFTLDGFRLIYALIAGLMWMMTTILSKEYFGHHENQERFYTFLLLTLGATMGVFLSADLYTTFIFFEIMSFTSYVWVAQEENESSLRAAATYLAVAVIGGLVMLMGIFLVYHELGTLQMKELLTAAKACENKTVLYAAGGCMLLGFGAKAGAFPLHIWLPKAHPVAPAPASALLSGILTKTGIFGILVVSCNIFLHDASWGMLILWIGVLTMFGGAMLAVFSIDLKRTLACSSMSQIGFIMVAVGMQGLLGEENALAVHGAFLHMMNHSMIKLVLFMAAGVIYMNTHSLDLNKIRGFGRKKPLLKVIFLIGALAIGGIPMFSGYVSKTLIHESIVEYSVEYGSLLLKAFEWIFLFSGGLTVAYMTKLFVSIFVEENSNKELQRKYDKTTGYMNKESTFALTGSAAILLIWGLFPGRLMDGAAALGQQFMHLEEFGHSVHYFNGTNLLGGCISISIGVVVYLLFIRKVLMKEKSYVNLWPAWFDMENLLYRPILLEFLPFVCGFLCSILDQLLAILLKIVMPVSGVICRILDSFPDLMLVWLRKTVYKDSPLPHERTEGTVLTEWLGHIANGCAGLKRRILHKEASTKDYVHILAMKEEAIEENNRIIGRSLSFGLMLAGIGFVLTMVYIIWL